MTEPKPPIRHHSSLPFPPAPTYCTSTVPSLPSPFPSLHTTKSLSPPKRDQSPPSSQPANSP
ncbi:uncharacterized protein BO66DRAFT_177813 [Aspergillus aculeatinus CBS 121060]|uniref:Uncharacterized protein n=1 Tax=Aspergillus aculeatinus CBS 121060 TaxID=1448322 RepID=A0ACD1HKU8_9EURO|nr:hypothetical protein BO66DRAFT_177813 [Aspergillus aculeatinus CBS 121060]RAH73993.1 hypothetical protein BO66DRAFT_177813 [Aspergillus aculeatinus CBS 121060]